MTKQATQPALSIVAAANANKKAPRQATAKPASTRAKSAADTIKAPKPTWDAELITRMAGNVVAMDTAKAAAEALQADVKFFRTNGITLGGSMRTCGICKEFAAAFTAAGKSKGTIANYLTALRAAINDGKTFNLNPARAKNPKEPSKGKKGAVTTTWKNPGEVLEALAAAIFKVSSKCDPKLWAAAMAAAPHGFEDTLTDFLDAQAVSEETE